MKKADFKSKIEKKKSKKLSIFSVPLGFGEEREYLVDNLAVLLRSGMGVVPSLQAIGAEAKSRYLKKIVVMMTEEIENGSPVWRAMDNTRLFSNQVISLIKLGEESARLPENLQVVASQRQKDRLFKSKVLSALLYPAFILVLSFLVSAWVLFFLLPQMAATFSSLNVTLPFLTTVMITIGDFVKNYWQFFVPLAGLLTILLFVILFVIPKTKFIGEFLLFKIPGVGRLLKESEIGRMGYLIGTLLGAGVTLVETVGSMSGAAGFKVYSKFYAFLAKQLEAGLTFQQCFSKYKKTNRLLPIPMQQLVVAAEQSGRLSEAFLGIGELYESRTELTAKNLSTILEPVLLVLVGLGVLFIALAVIMPIYSLIGGLGGI